MSVRSTKTKSEGKRHGVKGKRQVHRHDLGGLGQDQGPIRTKCLVRNELT